MATRRFAVKFGGGVSDAYHDGQIKISYFNVFSAYNADEMKISSWSGGKAPYNEIFPEYKDNELSKNTSPMIQNYTKDDSFDLTNYQGMCALSSQSGNHYSVYRREYEVYERPGKKVIGYYYSPDGLHYYFYKDAAHTEMISPRNGWCYIDGVTKLCYQYTDQRYVLVDNARVYKGPWEPVAIKSSLNYFYDFNIASGHSYQYIMYPADSLSNNNDDIPDKVTQIFANGVSTSSKKYYVWKPDDKYEGQGKIIKGTLKTANKYGEPVPVFWDAWSICELEPSEYDDDIPIVKNAYKVNLDQVWLFKYSLETGAQTQNISRNEFQTLGQFPKIGFGESNYVSGEVSALLGEEIIPYNRGRAHDYIERLRGSRVAPMSTNERIKMLQQWRQFVSSKNPKLLRDIKGQSWIVHLFSGSNTPKDFYFNQPDTISFQWKQTEDVAGVVIYSPVEDTPDIISTKGEEEWTPIFKGHQNHDTDEPDI